LQSVTEHEDFHSSPNWLLLHLIVIGTTEIDVPLSDFTIMVSKGTCDLGGAPTVTLINLLLAGDDGFYIFSHLWQAIEFHCMDFRILGVVRG
jgi:hypothetical protein